jgi:hypothetical protein
LDPLLPKRNPTPSNNFADFEKMSSADKQKIQRIYDQDEVLGPIRKSSQNAESLGVKEDKESL